jgi:hypothetical protein
MSVKIMKSSSQAFKERLKAVPFVPISWRPQTIKYESTEQPISGSAGLGFITDLFYDDPLFEQFKKCLPPRRSNASYDSELFAMTSILSIIEGHDCIDDIAAFQHDPFVLKKLGGEIPSTYAMGDYYRDFGVEHRQSLNEFLRTFARRARKQVAPGEPLVIDIDSTSHVQRGLKMEGVEWNFKHKWCLDSLAAWDELGFCHGMELRPGSTFSSQGAPDLIAQVFSHLKHGDRKFLRGDSAFHNMDCILACVRVGASFTISAHRNSTWEDKVKNGAISEWIPWEYSQEELKKAGELGVKPPIVELGSMVYKPGWSDNLRFYVVVKRTLVKDKKGNEIWKHYGIVTNWNMFRTKLQTLVEFHQKRGNSENFFKEEKWAYDMLHFPMQKLHANHAYGLLAMVAHNILRTIALLQNRKRPMFAKALRRRFVHIPGRLVHSSNRWWIRIPDFYRKEVDHVVKGWVETLQTALARAG